MKAAVVIFPGSNRDVDVIDALTAVSGHEPVLVWHRDTELPDADLSNIRTPRCPVCSGVVKPDVVFFGENVPRERVDDAMTALRDCRGVLVVGSSLAVYSGFRFCRRAKELGLPVAAINDGVTRADDFLAVKHDGACTDILASLATLWPGSALA